MRRVLLILVFVAAAFGIGFVTGQLESARALEGCDYIATSVNNMLLECDWQRTQCKIELEEQVEANTMMLNTFLPNRLNR